MPADCRERAAVRVFTIGTDHRAHYDFARLLVKYGVEVLIDVRRSPRSQEEHFCRGGLQSLAATQGIDYIYMGNELGGPQPGDFRPWTTGDEFKRGIDLIQAKAARRACCILCAERTPENCHRRVIAEQLSKQGIEVVHILDESSVWRPLPPRAFRRMPGRGHERHRRPRPG